MGDAHRSNSRKVMKHSANSYFDGKNNTMRDQWWYLSIEWISFSDESKKTHLKFSSP